MVPSLRYLLESLHFSNRVVPHAELRSLRQLGELLHAYLRAESPGLWDVHAAACLPFPNIYARRCDEAAAEYHIRLGPASECGNGARQANALDVAIAIRPQ